MCEYFLEFMVLLSITSECFGLGILKLIRRHITKHTHRVNVKYCFEVKNAKHGDDARIRSYI